MFAKSVKEEDDEEGCLKNEDNERQPQRLDAHFCKPISVSLVLGSTKVCSVLRNYSTLDVS